MKKAFALGFVVGAVISPFLIVAGGIGWLRLTRAGATESALAAPVLPQTRADYDWTVQTLGGDSVSFEEFKGDVVFLTFWRPTCGSCKRELPYIQSLYEKLEDTEIEFAMVATEHYEDWLTFIEKHGITFPIYVAPDDYPDMYKTGTVPTTFILNRDGTIAARFRGAAAWDDESSVNFLRGLAISTPPERAP